MLKISIFLSFLFGGILKGYVVSSCTSGEFRCLNGNCIERKWFCDQSDDCGDGSDETYCNFPYTTPISRYYNRVTSYACPVEYPFFQCNNSKRCIPDSWHCDGILDCKDKSDEKDCPNVIERIAGRRGGSEKANSWILSHRIAAGPNKWSDQVTRAAVALHLADPTYFVKGYNVSKEIRYEMEIKFLSRQMRKQIDPLTTNELALFIQAFLVTCMNPREFYGMNLVKELRELVDKQDNYTNPFIFLTLCNAKETITQRDVEKLEDIAQQPQRPVWTDIQAFTLMALACISGKYNDILISDMDDLASELRSKQSAVNGRIENLKTTALVMQALIASGKEVNEDWDMEKSVKYLVDNQKQDGSFGNFLTTYYALPVLHYKSLLNVSSEHCKSDGNLTDEGEAIANQEKKVGPKIHARYYLWYGDKVDLARSLELAVPTNSTFFDVMKLAAAMDTKYRFEYSILNGNPYVYNLAEIEDDPEKDKFWFLYIADKEGKGLQRLEDSPAKVIAADNDIFVMWYRTGHWNQPHVKMLDRFSSNSHNKEVALA